jgi:hypothetical protein
LEEFGACWKGLADPRTGNATLHDLHELLMIALCAVICGGENAMDMAAFAKHAPAKAEGERAIAARLSPAGQWRSARSGRS